MPRAFFRHARYAGHHLRSKAAGGEGCHHEPSGILSRIGLFGTVWGIMEALKGISAAGSASLGSLWPLFFFQPEAPTGIASVVGFGY